MSSWLYKKKVVVIVRVVYFEIILGPVLILCFFFGTVSKDYLTRNPSATTVVRIIILMYSSQHFKRLFV